MSKPWRWLIDATMMASAALTMSSILGYWAYQHLSGARRFEPSTWPVYGTVIVIAVSAAAWQYWVNLRNGHLPASVRVDLASGELQVRRERRRRWRRRRLDLITHVRVIPIKGFRRTTEVATTVLFGQWRFSLSWTCPPEGLAAAEQFADYLRRAAGLEEHSRSACCS